MRNASKRTELARWIAQHKPDRIGTEQYREIAGALAPVSSSYLRRLLRECGVPLAPEVEGVRQDNLDSLEHSLVTLAALYETGDRERQRTVRAVVRDAKDHAKLAARRDGSQPPRQDRQEMILWMLTWLENPPLFPHWVKLRRLNRENEAQTPGQ